MSTYVDDWGYQQSLATRTVHTDTPSAKVTYRSEDGGKKFSVIVRQKPNPIGFTARLPGDATIREGKVRKGWINPDPLSAIPTRPAPPAPMQPLAARDKSEYR